MSSVWKTFAVFLNNRKSASRVLLFLVFCFVYFIKAVMTVLFYFRKCSYSHLLEHLVGYVIRERLWNLAGKNGKYVSMSIYIYRNLPQTTEILKKCVLAKLFDVFELYLQLKPSFSLRFIVMRVTGHCLDYSLYVIKHLLSFPFRVSVLGFINLK